MKKTSLRIVLILTVSTIVFSSCSLTKEGRNTTYFNSQKLENIQELLKFKSEQKVIDNTNSKSKEILACETWRPTKINRVPMEAVLPTIHVSKKLSKPHSTPTSGDCDEILIYGGEKIKAKVLEVGQHEIKYKKCDNPDGPTYTVSKSDVKGIQYANGTNETITESASDKIAPLLQNDYLNLALLRLLYAGLLYLAAFLLTLVAALLASAAIVFSVMFLILAYVCIFIGALFSVAFMVYYICWLLKLVS